MLIIRGVNVYPSQIEAVLVGQSAIAPHYQLVVDRRGTLDHVTVEAEAQPGVAAADYDAIAAGRPSHQVDDRHHDRRDGEAAGLDPAFAGQGGARARRTAQGSIAGHVQALAGIYGQRPRARGRGRRPTPLVDYLRETAGLTGTKQGCDGGECGACTVLVDGEPRLACITLAVTCEGRRVETIESLAVDGRMSRLQQMFHEKLGTQCGFCTPGMIMAAEALLRGTPRPTEQQIRDAPRATCAAAPAT